MADYAPQPGDRVRIEGTVNVVRPDVLEIVTQAPTWLHVSPDDITLIDRPAPPLPTEPGTTGVATVRGVPGVRVMRTDHFVTTPWISAGMVPYGRGWTAGWHADADLADFTPDPQPSGAVTAEPTADTGPAPEPDLCECGHRVEDHSTDGDEECCWDICPCTAYRPAPSPTDDEEERAERLEGMVEWLTEVIVDAREACERATTIEPEGSPEWVESGIAMRTTALREVRQILNRERNAHPSARDAAAPSPTTDTANPEPDLLYQAWCLLANARSWDERLAGAWDAARDRWRDSWHPTLLSPQPEPEPVGLVERVARAMRDASEPWEMGEKGAEPGENPTRAYWTAMADTALAVVRANLPPKYESEPYSHNYFQTGWNAYQEAMMTMLTGEST